MRIGSLCSGYGGLEMGAQVVLGGTVAWHCENDPAASKVLAHHWPDVPNHGDLTVTDWSTVEPVDVLTAGFPCQPVSHAGKRLGDQDERWLWDDVARAVRDLRPRLVILENVRGLLTFRRGSLFGRVLGDLAHIGYDARWIGIRASDGGAPHGRFRVFITAYPTGDGRHEGRTQPARLVGGPNAALGGHGSDCWYCGEPAEPDTFCENCEAWCPAADTAHIGHERGGDTRDGRPGSADRHSPTADTSGARAGWDGRAVPRTATPNGWTRVDLPAVEHGSTGPADAALAERRGTQPKHLAARPDGAAEPRERAGETAWGQYEPAIRRWERTLGRSAPAPTESGRSGQRLSPRFVEWMMGLPAGHITDVSGISRNDQLKILGNGVVPQQAALALRLLLNLDAERAA